MVSCCVGVVRPPLRCCVCCCVLFVCLLRVSDDVDAFVLRMCMCVVVFVCVCVVGVVLLL